MDEVYEFCARMLGVGTPALHATHEAFATGGSDRLGRLTAAVQACRSRADQQASGAAAAATGGSTLAEAVAREVADATATLTSDQRQALALRELVGLSHHEIEAVMGVEEGAAGPLLARARLALRAQRRGAAPEPDEACSARERALLLLVRRQDGEPRSDEDDSWILTHLGSCDSCARVHSSLLEASVCYRAWRPVDPSQARAASPGRRRSGAPTGAVGDAAQ